MSDLVFRSPSGPALITPRLRCRSAGDGTEVGTLATVEWMRNVLTSPTYPRLSRDTAKWKEWAAEHGWTYEGPEVPELIGRYFPPPGDGSREFYYRLLNTVLRGLDVAAFERRIRRNASFWSRDVEEQTVLVTSYVVVRLPGSAPPELLAMGSRGALSQLRVRIADYDVELRDEALVASRPHPLDPRRRRGLGGAAEGLAAQIASMPASFWRPRPQGSSG